jgi:hypothetical protein
MSFAQQVPEADDRQRLGVFVWMLYEDLDSVVAVRRELFDGGGYLDFIEVLPRAWEEVGAARQRVLDEVVAADQEALEVAGLTDSSLLAKLEAWNSARDRMLDEFDVGGPEDLPPPGVPSPPQPPPRGLRRLTRWVRRRRPLRRKRALQWLARTLAHADNLLDSLTAVIGAAEPLKELKKAIERVADDTANSLADDS